MLLPLKFSFPFIWVLSISTSALLRLMFPNRQTLHWRCLLSLHLPTYIANSGFISYFPCWIARVILISHSLIIQKRLFICNLSREFYWIFCQISNDCQAKSPGQESMYLKPCKIINFRTPSQTTSKGMFRKLLNAPDHRVNTKTLYTHKQIVK